MSDDLDPAPGSGIAALAGKRKVMAPPPLASDSDEPPSADKPNAPSTPDHDRREATVAQPTPLVKGKRATKAVGNRSEKTNRASARANPKDLLGSKVPGNRRRVGVRMPVSTRELLDAEAERRQCSLGFAAMVAVRQEHRRIRQEHRTESVDDGFAAQRTMRTPRQPGPKVVAGILVTPEEAAALQQLADEVGWSVNRIIVESIESAFRNG